MATKKKTCPKCGKQFNCMHGAHCWCMNYKLSKESLAHLMAVYPGCLCPACLSIYAEKIH